MVTANVEVTTVVTETVTLTLSRFDALVISAVFANAAGALGNTPDNGLPYYDQGHYAIYNALCDQGIRGRFSRTDDAVSDGRERFPMLNMNRYNVLDSVDADFDTAD